MTKANSPPKPDHATAALILSDETIYWGRGIGAFGAVSGEICFNTSMTGYQEILTDPSYCGQIITFTAPHIGNTGANHEDNETSTPRARGLILRQDITSPASWRARSHLNCWLRENRLTGLCGIDTRALTRRIRDLGAPNGVISFPEDGRFDIPALIDAAKKIPDMEGFDLAREVSCAAPYEWTQTGWDAQTGYGELKSPRKHVVAIDYGIKHNILRCLATQGCRVTVVPCTMSAKDILALKPDGIFLSNGPGDPAATGAYALPVIRELIKSGLPLFGICLGHQLLGLALGARTAKLHMGHRGANHPVKDLRTGKIEITSQNHGFHVLADTLPDTAEVTHVSLFDGTNEGLRLKGKPVFSVQYHPEASPGPQDSHYLFDEFFRLMNLKEMASA